MKRRIAVWLGRSSENGFQTTFELFAVGVDPLPLFAQGVFEGFLFFLRAVEAVGAGAGEELVEDGERVAG